jgi:SagB-type dehydrogenase family enzyme
MYEKTSLTYKNVAKNIKFIDWESQPLMKEYPDFFSYDLRDVEIIYLSRFASEVLNINKKPYTRLNIPSAGNLHPTELYVQIRGIKNIISGIYHVNAKKSKLTLIKEIYNGGIENELDINMVKGIIFLVSVVPFRSFWKYGTRSYRYTYLDAGHQIGALLAASKICKKEIYQTEIKDYKKINKFMGFCNEEFALAAFYTGEIKETKVSKTTPLIKVFPTNYTEWEVDTNLYLKGLQKCNFNLFYPKIKSKKTLFQRRSARGFKKRDSYLDFYFFFFYMLKFLDEFSLYLITLDKINRVYKNAKLVKKGNFTNQIVKMCVNQGFIKNATYIFIITAKQFNQNTLLKSGMLGQKIYLEAVERGWKVSAIGAFYDKAWQRFLKTNEKIHYIISIGG